MSEPKQGRGRGIGHWFERLGGDLRFSFRSLRRAPGFSAAVFATLALCIGPNTAILATLYSFVLKPLPFPAPGQLVVIMNVADRSGGATIRPAWPQYLDFREHADQFERFALLEGSNTTIGEESAPVRVNGNQATPDFFPLLGITPRLGRFFTAEEAAPGRDHVLVLTQNFWERKYNSDPGVIGREVRMGGETFTIIGVAPHNLDALFLPIDFYRPFTPPRRIDPQARYGGRSYLIGRLKPGVRPEAGLAELGTIEHRFRTEVANAPLRSSLEAGGYRLSVTPLRNENAELLGKSLWLLEGGVLFVLLIGCVNAVNLWLARANARRTELAIRHALGAGPATLLRQLVVESLILTLAATAAGLGLAWAAIQVINRYIPVVARSAQLVPLDGRVVAAIACAALGIAFVLGMAPFLLLWRSGLGGGASRTASSSRAIRALSGSLVVVQVAVAFVLLVGAGLLIRSFANVVAVSPGFDAAHVVQGRVALPHAYDQPADNAAVRRRILEKLREIPGVESVAAVANFGVGPASTFRPQPFSLHSAAAALSGSQPLVIANPVSAGFFETMGIHLVEGRLFSLADEMGAETGVIVEQGFAGRYFPGRSAVGEELAFGTGPFPNGFKWPRIIGVVTRANLVGLEARDGLPFVYTALAAQQPSSGFSLLVRSPRPAGDLLAGMRAKLREVDPTLPLYGEGTLQATLDDLLMGRRGIMLLLGVFSGLAVLLAGIGLYGVLAYDVSQRTREIGIRAALGASPRGITLLILRQGLWKSALGLGAGLIGAVLLTRYVQALLFDVKSGDPLAFAAVPLLLLLVAALASWLPARRAARVDAIVALRCE